MASYYDLLGLTSDATSGDIRRAFRAAAKRVHPDAQPGPNDAMVAVNVAYETLKDPARRAAYDHTLGRTGLAAPLRPTKAPRPLDAATFRARVFLPLDRELATALDRLDTASEELAFDPADDGHVDSFDRAVLLAAAALDEARRGLSAAAWPDALAAGLNSYCQGVRQAQDALEDFFRFAQQYDGEVVLEGRELLRAAVRLLTQARGVLASA